ncbi:MAG TPA: DUF4349 domain-containing protein [Ilumatobacter sp.]|nr:DUF4349 domain-containing protein [Ilumatobacter sp.]
MIVAGSLALSACSSGSDDSSADEATAEEPAAEPAAEEPADGGFATGGDDTADTETGGSTGDPSIDLGQIGRDVIIEMHLTVSSDDIQRSVSSVSARAAALGGGVASSDVNFGNPAIDGPNSGYAVLVVKVPPSEVDALISGIEQTGTIQSINQSAQDVTEQLIDLEVRIANARESVENVRAFMERAENLTDLVTLESELTRRQTDLERLEAQERNLSERVAFSTITVEIIPTAAVPEPADDEDDSIADAFRQGWDGFTGMIWGIGYVLAVLLPFLVLGALVGVVVLLVVRRRHHAATPRDPSAHVPHPHDPSPSPDPNPNPNPNPNRNPNPNPDPNPDPNVFSSASDPPDAQQPDGNT